MNIDEIYDLFIWDKSFSDEEYAQREKKGIEEASRLKNIYPFIQPVIVPPEKSKSVWEPCAKVIALKSDEELKPFLYLLLEWLQDVNWPGAYIIINRLAQMPFSAIEADFLHSKRRAEKAHDELWTFGLDELFRKFEPSSTGQ